VMSHLVHGHHGYLVLWRRDGHAAPNVDGGAGGGGRRPQVACVGAVHIGVRRDGPSHLLVGGEVPRSILLLLEISEAGSVVEPAIHILGTVPLGVSEVPCGLADGAHEGPEHRAGHQAAGVLQSVASVLSLSFSVGLAELTQVELVHGGHSVG